MVLKCLNCGDETSWVYVCQDDKSPLKGGRGSANLVIKCKLCSRENSIDIIEGSVGPYNIEDSESRKYKTIVAFDCRGIEPTNFSPRIGFQAVSSESNTAFTDINLSEEDWADYDSKKNISVGIYELQHRFIKLK
ncbi:uncharacterized protein TRIADDRAFT_57890 [Trichoplax adhaerens]|uniref:CXXC motif containing zinc binding protein n=1 Tax=Trichoplax adhaerens TaxID=10228 RepID=B3S1U7_TRIAD|nr:hypothetical protein TRIADDRAFT_57890 [Trichoplax adhaerens]EDV23355.1 hypothetical protein TRIADDRAFT_57890 [Trichoplax adhaerens]|eukprot:XP_002114265.1 hypothetical protein TRIADDRAFT_57890 [Trichoplax adhaerens]